MSQIEEIKEKVDIVEVIGERVALKKAGKNYKGLCPFHSEKTPSFMVSSERGTFKCFGCGEGGDVISFLEKYEGMTFLEALEYLAERTGVKLEKYKPNKHDLRQKRLLEILDLAAEFYAWILNKHDLGKRAEAYLKERQIFSEARKNFKLGYAPASWRSVSDFLIKKKNYRIEEVEAVGLMVRKGKNVYDRFRGRLMFPLRDARGRVLGFSGRVLVAETKEAKYINSPETELYAKRKMLYGLFENKQAIRKMDKIILVEGEMDVLASWQAGVKNVVAIKGSAFTEDQAQLIKRYTKNIVMALDADQAGEEAIKRAVEIADKLDLNVRVVEIRGGKDPGEVATKDPSEWRRLVGGAVSYYDFLIDSLSRRLDIKTEEGLKRLVMEVGGSLIKISNAVVRAHYAKKLAGKLGVSEEIINEELEKLKKRAKLSGLQSKIKQIETSLISRRERLEGFVLSLIFQGEELLGDEGKKLEVEWFDNPALRKIYQAYLNWRGKLKIGELGKRLGEELQSRLDEVYLRDLSGIDTDKWLKEFIKAKTELKEMFIREEMAKLAKKIAKAEKGEEETELRKLQEKFTKLARELASLD